LQNVYDAIKAKCYSLPR